MIKYFLPAQHVKSVFEIKANGFERKGNQRDHYRSRQYACRMGSTGSDSCID